MSKTFSNLINAEQNKQWRDIFSFFGIWADGLENLIYIEISILQNLILHDLNIHLLVVIFNQLILINISVIIHTVIGMFHQFFYVRMYRILIKMPIFSFCKWFATYLDHTCLFSSFPFYFICRQIFLFIDISSNFNIAKGFRDWQKCVISEKAWNLECYCQVNKQKYFLQIFADTSYSNKMNIMKIMEIIPYHVFEKKERITKRVA